MAETEIQPTDSAVAAVSGEEIAPLTKTDESVPKYDLAGESTAAIDGEKPPSAGEIDEEESGEDHKRKLEEIEEKEDVVDGDGGLGDGVKRQRIENGETVDGSAANGGEGLPKVETQEGERNDQDSSVRDTQDAADSKNEDSNAASAQEEGVSSAPEQGSNVTTSRKIEVPNNKVGVLIGKAGDTIRFLQINSGARIQITRDAEADPNSSTRPVELIGTLEHINKAEMLIRDVIAEADAGGSPSLVARGFGTAQSGAEQLEIQVPTGKVGSIIGKGGETIKNLQMKSGARIQLITQDVPDGDASKEKTIRITGNRKQIEVAQGLIKDVMNQVLLKPSTLSGGYGQQNFRPRGSSTLPQWGNRAPHAQPGPGYDYHQRGTYPPNTQYSSQHHGAYSHQGPPRSSYGGAWDQRSSTPVQPPPQTGGYDYYGQGMGTPSSNHHVPGPGPVSNPPPVNYNYGQSPAANYGHPAPYGQTAPSQQMYGHEGQGPNQQFYGQPPSSQPGVYGQHMNAPHSGYSQQQNFGNPAYGGAPSQVVPQTYAPQGTSQPGDPMYQNTAPPAYGSSYGSGGPPQQSYLYSSNAQMQPAPAYGQSYGPTSGHGDGYGPNPSAQYGGAGYSQGGQPAQTGQHYGGYGQYPQQGYGAQPVANNASYGYQAAPSADGYGGTPSSTGYNNAAAPVSGQAGYVQPASNPTGYDQSVPPQASYAPSGSAPVSYS